MAQMLQLFRRICGSGAGRGKKDQTSKEESEMTDTSTTSPERRVYQPIHPSVRPLLDPEYVAFHDKYAQYVVPENMSGPWDGSLRTRYTWPYSGSPVVDVGSVKDIRPDPKFAIRVFTPAGTPPAAGWPVLIWLHGGGWIVGNIESDNDLCSLICRDTGCVVLNVDYRLAPEHQYPAAIEDVSWTLRWINTAQAARDLSIDHTKIMIGGASSGANLAAVGAILAADLNVPLILSILVVPVTDNTATVETRWAAHKHSPWLTPVRMAWFRSLYLPDKSLETDWKVSPLFASKERLGKSPKTWVAIAEQDLLSTEGRDYIKALREAGVEVEVHSYPGMPHTMMALSGVLHRGRQSIVDIVDAVRRAINP